MYTAVAANFNTDQLDPVSWTSQRTLKTIVANRSKEQLGLSVNQLTHCVCCTVGLYVYHKACVEQPILTAHFAAERNA